MKSFFGGLWDFFKPLPPKRSRVVEVTVKNKDALKKLKSANKELRLQLENQTELLTNVVKELAQLKRDVAALNLEK